MPPTASTIDIRFGCDTITIAWSERHKAIDVGRNLVKLHVPELPELLLNSGSSSSGSDAQRCKVLVEVATRLGTFVCCDVEQLEQTLSLWSSDYAAAAHGGDAASARVAVDVVVLVATDGAIKKLYRKDLALLQGCLTVVLAHNGDVVGHCRFDRARPPTLSELEDAVDELPWAARHRSGGGGAIRMGWRTVAVDGGAAKPPPGSPTLEIDGEADMKALCADVRSYGLDGVQLCLQIGEVGGSSTSPFPQGHATAAGSAVTAQQILKGARPNSAATSRGAMTTTSRSHATATTATRQAMHHRPASAAPTSTASLRSELPSGRSPGASPQRGRTPTAMEDDDADYVAISYVLNPPVITVVAYMEEAQLATLCKAILDRCVTSARVAAMRGGPPSFERAPRNVGVFPVYTLSLPRSYFDEMQEMALSVTILDAMSSFGAFRYVPLDGSCEREGFNSVQAQRDKSKMMLNLGGARASSDLIPDRQPSKRSAQFFFVPK